MRGFIVLGAAASLVVFVRAVSAFSSFEGKTFGRLGWVAFAVATAAFATAAMMTEASE